MPITLAAYITRLRKNFWDFCGTRLDTLNLTNGLLYFLIYIGNHPACTPGELATALEADTGHTARSVEKLVAQGYVLRTRSKRDGRAFSLSLTSEGKRAFAQLQDLFGLWDQQVCGDLTPQEKQQLLNLLDQVWRKAASNKNLEKGD